MRRNSSKHHWEMATPRTSKTPGKTGFRCNLRWLLFLGGMLLLGGCDMNVQEPVLPSWSVPVTIPLAQETFNIAEEIVNDSTIVVQGADSLVFLSLTGNLETLSLSAADFSVGRIDTSHTFSIGTLKIASLEVLKTGPVSLGSFFPELANLVSGDQSIPFTMPDTTFTPAPTKLSAGDFIGMQVISGELNIIFTNNLPFPIGPNTTHPEGLTISVFDSTGTKVIDFVIDQPIAEGQTIENSARIGGPGTSWIYAPLQVQYVLPIAEATTFELSATVLSEASFNLDVALENLEVDEAIARMESQEVRNRGGFALEEGMQLQEAAVSSGRIRLDFHNQTEVSVDIDFQMPTILNAQNQPFTSQLSIPQNGSATLEVPLSGMRIADSENPGGMVDSVVIDYRTVTSTANDIIHLRSSDEVRIDIQIDSIAFESLSGIINERIFDIDPVEESDLFDYEGVPHNIHLDFVDFGLRLQNEFFIEDLQVNLTIVGYHEENGVVTDSARLEIAGQQINPGYPGNPGVTMITVPGETAAAFLNILPTRVRTFGQVAAAGEVAIDQSGVISGDYSFATPLRFRIDGDAVYTGDVSTLDEDDISDEVRDAADENFEEATLTLHLINSTPLGGSVRLFVSADTRHNDIYDPAHLNPELEFIKEVVVIAGEVDANTGYVSEPASNEVTLTLTRDEFRIFKRTPIKVGFELHIDGTDGPVAIRAQDFVTVSGIARIMLNIKD